MPFVPAPQVVRVELCFTLDTEQVQNVFHYKLNSGEPTIEQLREIAEFVRVWWVQNLMPNCSNITRLRLMRSTSLTTKNSPGIEFPPLAQLIGGHTSPGLPNNVTFAIKWSTGLRGRSYRGRTFHVGTVQADVQGSRVHPNNVASYETAYSKLITEAPVGWTFGVRSIMLDKLPRDISAFTPIVACSLDPNLDSMRRRLPGRGQ